MPLTEQIGAMAIASATAGDSGSADADTRHCASCGHHGDGLKKCTACKSVWYCNVTCQRAHRKMHKKECKRIEANLKDAVSAACKDGTKSADGFDAKIEQILQTWEEIASLDDCPLCMIPLHRNVSLNTYLHCCGTVVCGSCIHRHEKSIDEKNEERAEKEKPPLPLTCPFCRIPQSDSDGDLIRRLRKRANAGDMRAIFCLAMHYRGGAHGLRKDEKKAIELMEKAAAGGFTEALGELGKYYVFGLYGVQKDAKKGTNMLLEAAVEGDVIALHNLGAMIGNAGDVVRALALTRKAAASGYDLSVETLWGLFRDGKISKSCIEETLRAHQAAKEDMKSEERDRFEKWLNAQKDKEMEKQEI